MEDAIREEMTVASFVADCTQTDPAPDVAEVSMEDEIRFHCCTRCSSVSRADQCRLDRLSATLVRHLMF
jgi:hypothetical protein